MFVIIAYPVTKAYGSVRQNSQVIKGGPDYMFDLCTCIKIPNTNKYIYIQFFAELSHIKGVLTIGLVVQTVGGPVVSLILYP